MSDSIDDEVDRRISCYMCSDDGPPNFEHFNDFLLHLDEAHRPLKMYACHFCARAFSTKGNLLCHDCTQFQDFIDANGLGSCKDCNFAYHFRSLICVKCGLQLAVNDLIGGAELIRFTAQLHHCLELHDPKTFVHCIVSMLVVSNFETATLIFLTNDKSLRPGAEEAFLSAYIAAACQFRDPNAKRSDGERVGPSFHGEKSLPRVKKGLTHSTFFSRHQLENGAEEYECKMCKSRTVPDPTPGTLVQHIHDAHHPNRKTSPSNSTKNASTQQQQQLRTFNAQTEFERIELPDGNCQYRCRICGHLTKLNVKANCLSQHFNDRHPEMRLVASESWVGHYLKRYGHLLRDVSDRTDIDEEKPIVLIDRDAASINDFTRGFAECRTTIRIYFPPFEFFHAKDGLQLLDVSVFACKQCNTICAGQRSATTHFKDLHFGEIDGCIKNFILLTTSHSGRPALRCPFCSSSHCSIMGLRLHLLREHEVLYSIRLKEEDEELYVPSLRSEDPKGAHALFSVKQEMDSANFEADDLVSHLCEQMFKESGSSSNEGNFNSQLQQILQNANHEIERKAEANGFGRFSASTLSSITNANNGYNVKSVEERPCASDFDNMRTKLEDGIQPEAISHFSTVGNVPTAAVKSSSENDLRMTVVEVDVSLNADEKREAAERAASAARAKLLKKNRFNAQKQFVLVDSPEGPRYQCKICDHVTKPGVSANTLSQHFSYRHPEMRARASGESSYIRRKKLIQRPEGALVVLSATPGRRSLAGALKRRGNNPFGYNGRSKFPKKDDVAVTVPNQTLLPQSEDDIVFGKFLQTISMEEFERLERSQVTVFPYLEIAIKANPRIPFDLAGALSLLYTANVDSAADRCQRITAFFGELLRKCRAKDVSVLCTIDKQLKSSDFSSASLLRMADDLLRQSGI